MIILIYFFIAKPTNMIFRPKYNIINYKLNRIKKLLLHYFYFYFSCKKFSGFQFNKLQLRRYDIITSDVSG